MIAFSYFLSQYSGIENCYEEAEKFIGSTTEEIEKSQLVKEGNAKVATTEQSFAMYGRVKMDANEKIFNKCFDLKATDVFIDIGHGIGSAVLQAAFTRGCESRGIELMEDRNLFAEHFNGHLRQQQMSEKGKNQSNIDCHQTGEVELREGNLKKKLHKDFIIEANKILVNNANEIFSGRSSEGSDGSLDDYIASLFARTKPGSIMVTLEKITALGRSRSEANDDRRRQNLIENDDASFFEYEKKSIGNCAVTWTDKDIDVWVYTRVGVGRDSVFLCSNKNCPYGHYTSVIQSDDEGDNIALLQDSCIYCYEKRLACKRTSKQPTKLECQEKSQMRHKTVQNTKKRTSLGQIPKREKQKKMTQNANAKLDDIIRSKNVPQYKTESSFNSDNSKESSGDEFELKENLH